jgi:cold shock CspA family protein
MPQGTIKSFDELTKTGVIVDDSRNELGFDHQAFKYGGIRLFRLGQRVRYELDGTRVSDLTILTMPR